MSAEAKQDLEPNVSVQHRLDQMQRVLDRICGEIDVCFRAMQALLIERQARKVADELAIEFEALKQERDEDIAERETLPPDPPTCPTVPPVSS